MKLYKPLLHRIRLAKERRRQNSAVTIQSAWRGFVVYSFYLIKRYENKAATKIQASWRGYWQETNYSVMYCAVCVVKFILRFFSFHGLHSEPSFIFHFFVSDCENSSVSQGSPRSLLACLPEQLRHHHSSFVTALPCKEGVSQ